MNINVTYSGLFGSAGVIEASTAVARAAPCDLWGRSCVDAAL